MQLPMTQYFFFKRSARLVTATALGLAGCSKPQPNAPSQDFARRHQCAVSAVTSDKEASNRMRITGCGESEIYVRNCENSRPSAPVAEPRQQITEAEVRHASPRATSFSEQGCAWTRQQNASAPRADGAPQPKWLSEP